MRQPPTHACRILLIICFSIFSNTFVNAQVAVKNYSACTIKVAICWSEHPGCTWEYDPQCDVEPICYSSQTFAPSTFATMASSCFPTTMACWIEVYDDSNNELIDLFDAGVPVDDIRARISHYEDSFGDEIDEETYLAASRAFVVWHQRL